MRRQSGASRQRCPETRLRSVVFPAPFGPMSPCTSPAPTAKVAPSTARTPPKARETPSTDKSTGGPPLLAPRAQAPGQRDEPVRQEEDDGQQHEPVREEAQ